ncbi:MAG: hypothetical protein Q6373_019240 [Candidatus Sigynarchaeota archaeon]
MMLIQGIMGINAYNSAMGWYNYYVGIGWPTYAAPFQLAANAALGQAIWNFIGMGVTLVLIFIYVLKPFSIKCAAKDWEALVADGKKMWIMWILLAVFSYWGCIGVAIPAIMLTFIGPGKGRIFGGKK